MKTKYFAILALFFLSNNIQASAGIDISDLDQVEVFRHLYNHAGSPGAAGFTWALSPEELDHEAAVTLFAKSVTMGEKVDYLQGRYMKVTFQIGSILTTQYDNHSTMSAQKIVDALRAEKTDEAEEK